jgi:hypothetical protein
MGTIHFPSRGNSGAQPYYSGTDFVQTFDVSPTLSTATVSMPIALDPAFLRDVTPDLPATVEEISNSRAGRGLQVWDLLAYYSALLQLQSLNGSSTGRVLVRTDGQLPGWIEGSIRLTLDVNGRDIAPELLELVRREETFIDSIEKETIDGRTNAAEGPIREVIARSKAEARRADRAYSSTVAHFVWPTSFSRLEPANRSTTTQARGWRRMTQYDLSESLDPRWAGVMLGLRIGMGVFAIVLLATTSYGVFRMAAGPGLDLLHDVGTGLIYFILSLFLLVAIIMRPAATGLLIDETGVRLQFKRGPPDVRLWNDAKLRLVGRRTDGVDDFISRGRPLWSIYGRFGGLTETFIPRAAFDDLVHRSDDLHLVRGEKTGRNGWFLYEIKP